MFSRHDNFQNSRQFTRVPCNIKKESNEDLNQLATKWRHWRPVVQVLFQRVLGLDSDCSLEFSAGSGAFERYYSTLYPPPRFRGGRLSWLVPILRIIAIQLLPSLEVSVYDVESEGWVENFPDYNTVRAYKLTWSFCNSVLPMCIMGYLYSRVILICVHATAYSCQAILNSQPHSPQIRKQRY